jgi:probable HAF family extracellular repeat protein
MYQPKYQLNMAEELLPSTQQFKFLNGVCHGKKYMKTIGINKTLNFIFILAMVLSTDIFLATPASAADYTAQDLGSLGGIGTRALAVNATGRVVGYSFTADGFYHAFMTGPNGVRMNDLGTFGGITSFASGINASGQVVGSFEVLPGLLHVFITGPNGVGMTDLGSFGGIGAYPTGINASGQVAGVYNTGAGPGDQHAFVTGPNGVGMTTLDGPGSGVGGINDAGQVSVNSSASHRSAFITGPNGIGVTNLGTLGGDSVFVGPINAAGQVVGSSTLVNSAQHAFITGTNGVGMIDLGTLGGGPSDAWGINASGQVVGYSLTADRSYHAFMTGPNGVGMTDLNSVVSLPDGVVLLRAFGINDSGQVIADTSLRDDGHAYLLSPVPEPESYALMLVGLSLLGFLARFRKQIGALSRYN